LAARGQRSASNSEVRLGEGDDSTHFLFESSVREAMTFSRVSRLFINHDENQYSLFSARMGARSHLLLMKAPSLLLSD